MIDNYKILIIMGSGILGLIIYSTLASVIFHFLAHIPFDSVSPISVYQHILKPNQFIDLQSKLFVSFGTPLLLMIFLMSQIYKPNGKNQLGSSKWATKQDIKKANLLNDKGIILGKFNGQYLMNDSPTHSMVIAPTRSGKGVGVIIPTLLNFQGSLVCLDLKHDNYKETAGFRKKGGHDVFMWAPADITGKSHCYNPLDFVSRDIWQQMSDLQVLAKILIPDDNKGSSFWENEARAFFIGLAIYVMDNDDMPSTIGAINRLLGTEEDLGEVCRHIIKTYKKTLPTTMVKTLMNFANKAAKERSGVKSTLNSALMLWDNPAIDAVTSKSDFDIRDLRKKKISIYVGVSTGQIATLAPLIRIFFEQIITTLTMKLPNDEENHKVLLLLDEFHMLGKMDVMTKAFTLLAGYSTRIMAVVQGLEFIDEIYGTKQRNAIMSCCAHQVFYTANDLETAKYVSESCGEQTIETTSTTRKKSFKYEAPSYNTSYRSRPLITKDEIRRLSNKESIILAEASNPIKCKKVVYWTDNNFIPRILPPPEVPVLVFKNEIIPKFNLPDPNDPNQNASDPNQIELLIDATNDEQDLIPDEEDDNIEENDNDFLEQPPNKRAN